jgi:phosphoglycolate phosphatase
MRNAKALFFDLDGTLTDSREGITRCFAYALQKMGVASPPLHELEVFIGPPLIESLGSFVGRDRAQQALDHYSDRYVGERRGILENKVYDGIAETLAALHKRKQLYLMTAKALSVSLTILDHFNLSRFFKHAYGPLPDELGISKGELIRRACREQDLAPADVVMIGDRRYDMIGARENKMQAIGVTWGYGSRDELLHHGANVLANRPEDLLTLV